MGDARPAERPEVVGEGEQKTPWLAAGCLAAVFFTIFAVVVLPALLWTAGILFAGGR
jgi:hypothetical protein